jgi:hypothetical protein
MPVSPASTHVCHSLSGSTVLATPTVNPAVADNALMLESTQSLRSGMTMLDAELMTFPPVRATTDCL